MDKTDAQKDHDRQYSILRYIDYDIIIEYCVKELDHTQITKLLRERLS